MKRLTQIAVGVLMVLTIACDKKSESTPVAAPPPTTYGYVNGQCYNTTTNAPAGAVTDCANVVINGSYRWNGTTCIDTAGTGVAQTSCYINGVLPIAPGGTVSGQYRWNGVTCTDLANNPVPTQYCQQTGLNSQFQVIGGNCIYSFTGQTVNSSYCAGLSGYVANQCNGYYIKYTGWGFYYSKYCQGTSCSGQTLVEYSTGRQVVCP